MLTDRHLRHHDMARQFRDPGADGPVTRRRPPARLLTAPDGAVISHHTAAAP
jgi:hypothetical protein